MSVAITEVHAGNPEYAVVTNLSSDEFDLSGYVLNAGDEGQDFTFPDGTKLAAGASVKVFTNKAAPGPGEFSYDSARPIWNNAGDVGMLRDPNRQPVSTHNYGTRHEPPKLVLEPAALTFTARELGEAGPARQFTIKNTGGSDLRLTGDPLVEIAGAQAGDFELLSAPAASIPPGGSTGFTIRFQPTAAGPRAAVLQLASNDPERAQVSAELMGEAIARAKFELEAEPALQANSHDFGEVAADGGAEHLRLRVRNPGAAELKILGVELGGATASFSVQGPSPTTIAAGGSVDYELTFDPVSGGTKLASLTISYDEGDGSKTRAVGLLGVGTGPEIELSTSVHDFGLVALGGASEDFEIVIRNLGKAPLKLDGAPPIRVREGAELFTIVSQPGVTSIAPDTSASFSVRFEAKQSGERHGIIEIVSNDEDESPYLVDLRGVGRRQVAGGARVIAEVKTSSNRGGLIAALPNGGVYYRALTSRWWKRVAGLDRIVGVFGHRQGVGRALDEDGRLWGMTGSEPILEGVVDVAVGRDHILALMEDGTVWASGARDWSQCGDGPQRAPGFTEVSGLDDVVQVAASAWCSLALRADGSVWHWGAVDPDRKRHDPTPLETWDIPKMSTIGRDWTNQTHGYYVGTTASGGGVFMLAYGTQRYEPTGNVPGVPQAVTSSLSKIGSSLALLADGSVVAHGQNDYNRLGVGGWFAPVHMTKVPGLPKIRGVLQTDMSSAAVGEDGHIYEWGCPLYLSGSRRGQGYAKPQKTF